MHTQKLSGRVGGVLQSGVAHAGFRPFGVHCLNAVELCDGASLRETLN